MKKKFILIICSAALVSLFLCSCQKSTNTTSAKNVKTVETIALSPSKYDVKLSYQGIVKANKTRNYFFTSSGKVSKVYVKEGQYIKKGDILATLDTTQLNFSYVSAQSNSSIAKNSLKKTISTYDTNIANAEANIETLKQEISAAESNLEVLKSTLEANEALYEAGAVSQINVDTQRAQYESSQANLDSLRSQLETSQTSLEQLKKDKTNDINTAQENLTLSRNSLDQVEKNITDATLIAEDDSYITNVSISEGDSAMANSTVITATSNNSKVSVGVSAEDYNKLSSVKQVMINNSVAGQIDNISIYPDEATNTYKVDINFTSDTAVIGEIVDVDLILNSAEGVFVPIDSVININGVNYVYKLNDDNTVSRVQVDIKEISEGKMLVANLSNEKIVTTNISTLNDNDVVSEIGQVNSLSQEGGSND